MSLAQMECVEKPWRGDQGFYSTVPSVTGSFEEDVGYSSDGVDGEDNETAMILFESKVTDPKAAFAEAVAKIDPSDLEASLVKAAETPEEWDKLLNFLNCLSDVLPGVSFEWKDIFKEPVWSKLFHDVIDVSDIPEPVYKVAIEYINEHLEEDVLLDFISWTFDDIMKCHVKGQSPDTTIKVGYNVILDKPKPPMSL